MKVIDVNLNETVTLTRDNYEKMKAEIEYLRNENAKKEIIVEVPYKWQETANAIACGLVISIFCFLFLLFETRF